MEVKPGDLDLWATETDEKVKEGLYELLPDQIPHPVLSFSFVLFVVLGG